MGENKCSFCLKTAGMMVLGKADDVGICPYCLNHLYYEMVLDQNAPEPAILSAFKKYMVDFCKGHPGVHSAWFHIDYNHRNITVFTVTNKWDFELESEIFGGPYGKLPVKTTDGYYIDQRVTFLNGGDSIEDILPSGYEQIYPIDPQ